MAEDPIPLLKAIFVKGFSNLRFFKTVFMLQTEIADFNAFEIAGLKKQGKTPEGYFKNECDQFIALAQEAKDNIFGGSYTAKKFKVTLNRIIDRAEIFLKYLKKKSKEIGEPNAGYLLMQDALILKEIYFEFLEDVGDKIKNAFSYGIKPEMIAELKVELETFRNNKLVAKMLILLDKFEEKPKPVAQAYLTLTKDDDTQKNIHQIRNYLKLVA